MKESLGQFGDVVALTALNLYPQGVETPAYQLTSMISDMRVTCGNDYLATIMSSAYQSPVFRYVATYIPHGYNRAFFQSVQQYAFHGIDIFGFFGTMDKLYLNTLKYNAIWEDLVQNEVRSFVVSGRPATPNWATYPDSVAKLGNTTTITQSYHTAHCEFWLANNFFSYSWIN